MKILQSLGYAVPPVSFIGGNLLELVTKNDLKTQIRWMTEVSSCCLFVALLLFIYWFVVVYSLFCCVEEKRSRNVNQLDSKGHLLLLLLLLLFLLLKVKTMKKARRGYLMFRLMLFTGSIIKIEQQPVVS
jgi:cytochrome bd-type quinol oxidase subunit 2